MKYVALLRGINVGGNNTIKMSELKACLEVLGLADVTTYINSGNIIFSSDKAKDELVVVIENCIRDNFGLKIPVIIRGQAEIARTAAKIPPTWVNDQAMRTDVLFLWADVDRPDVLDEISINPDVDQLIYTPGAVVWHFDRAQYRQSKMHSFIGTRVYKLMTARNVNTVRKLHQLMQSD